MRATGSTSETWQTPLAAATASTVSPDGPVRVAWAPGQVTARVSAGVPDHVAVAETRLPPAAWTGHVEDDVGGWKLPGPGSGAGAAAAIGPAPDVPVGTTAPVPGATGGAGVP